MTPITVLTYRGSAIRLRGGMLNLTDLWHAADRPDDRRPSDWLDLEETQRLRTHAGIHWTEIDDPVAAHAGLAGILNLDTDGLVATVRGNQGGTWAHWQLALPYARTLSPHLGRWCATAVRAAMERQDDLPAAGNDLLLARLAQHFRDLHSRFDTVDRHVADLMFLMLSAQDLVLGMRRNFSGLSQAAIIRAVAAAPFEGQCPCCGREPVLTEAGRPAPGAEFDHAFHRSLNRPEHGWLVCRACHAELTYGGYLARFARMAEFRAFQAAVLEQRRRARTRAGTPTV
jgi:hypothetical protein